MVDSKKKEYYEIVELENVIKVESGSFEIINMQRDYIQNELLLQLKKLKTSRISIVFIWHNWTQ
ncbi:hypothetical protein [Bacillus mycoides]|uniref:hypothetical protein n=1 Tax=Bacillus mycoides TaxID=1405 RepID=UPI0027365125|nr:hypothetical protein [Bacillus mycoides]WOA60350.1 hypothetical protein RVY74_29295 [Bacillus mycoides]